VSEQILNGTSAQLLGYTVPFTYGTEDKFKIQTLQSATVFIHVHF